MQVYSINIYFLSVVLMPSLGALVTDVGLSLPIAFQLVRPLIRSAIQASDSVDSCPENLRYFFLIVKVHSISILISLIL